ncbi:tripartite tricarboxylate transporter substrate binding protein [Pseudorhodoferax sp. Leaf265]|uniref:Bug family tripartite tricarboxylate transporter substrate binding protein n=1 Tax=Pseudorhodoferax sp. Leaf265 TaxID=1736315 RepID=UPI0006F769C6|nr:tripartite tricarboxylate transporter substrate binding protein [Pseudorhodoferax sp. Leaf265]KQP15267.1 ABC transporter substrate-binding protein [Pseudorhodoferax sp. Leaf265]PZQ01541.1 MAG: tripartite tricarboxylate transporter substrate binding protein [Variovorax paradoxus]PZQ14620.1 MAG: tripartite tricarboxylate transporter substrate binding protein [Variovorax paradoxus]
MNAHQPHPCTRRTLLRATAAAGLLAAGSGQAQDAWPARPIRLVVGFPAGGTTDIMARVVGLPLQKALGQPIVVDNRPGASGNIAASETIRAAADGHTFMVAPISVQTANPSLFKPALNPARDLQPVSSLGYAQLYLVARKGLPAGSSAQLVALAKAAPGKLSYGSGGPGTQMHLVGELFKQQAGIDVVHVPYKGAAPALQDILAGQIDYYFDPATGLQHIREGRARLLAVSGTRRSPFFPDAPTLTEAGIPGVELGNWFGLFAPARTPPAIVQRMAAEVAKALQLPEVRQRFAELGVETIAQDGTGFGKTIADETAVLTPLIRARGIAVD